MCSLDRLINLASRTGDRLIIHNLAGKDMVMMNVEQYEDLIFQPNSVYDLTSDELIDRINRDISVWRSNQETEETGERSRFLEDELWERENPINCSNEEDWCNAGSVIDDRYGNSEFNFDDEDEDNLEEEDFKVESDLKEDSGFVSSIPLNEDENTEKKELPAESLPSDEAVFYEEPV